MNVSRDSEAKLIYSGELKREAVIKDLNSATTSYNVPGDPCCP